MDYIQSRINAFLEETHAKTGDILGRNVAEKPIVAKINEFLVESSGRITRHNNARNISCVSKQVS